MQTTPSVVIVSAVRTAVGRAGRGTLKNTRPDELAAAALRGAVEKLPQLNKDNIDDVIIGCATHEGPQSYNVARIASLRAGFPVSVPAITINRFCASGLETIAMGAEQILSGRAEVVIAGGVESMSQVPFGVNFSPNPALIAHAPDTYLSMGLTAENLTRKYGISRAAQDSYAYESHRKAIEAIDAGKFREEIVPLTIEETHLNSEDVPETVSTVFDTDEGPRRDTSPEALASLKPVFHVDGTVTAGNASQMSDAAAAVVLMSETRAKADGYDPLAHFVSYATAGVPPEIMGIGPVSAIPKALASAGLTLADIDVIELNEAFAVQALAVLQEAQLPSEKVNVNGGAVALGHPLGCTGTKLTVSLINEMHRQNHEYGMVTMCVGGGMGAAGIFQTIR
ncbi:thiolase family protein [Candidatus Poribacteria bacterium]|nr:thiolase family protein [Candidatus Poribacteria bacterium]MYB01220.1 thiolase family protein [Candidatus Poribacteria bacterium]